MSSRPSSSGKGSAPASQQNLNPLARAFSPTNPAPSTSAAPEYGMYHQYPQNPPCQDGFVPPQYHYPAPAPPAGVAEDDNPSASSHGAIPPSSSRHDANLQDHAGETLSYHLAKGAQAANMAIKGRSHPSSDPTHTQPLFPPRQGFGPFPQGPFHAAPASPIPPSRPGIFVRPHHALVPPLTGRGLTRQPQSEPAGHPIYTAYASPLKQSPPQSTFSAPSSAGSSARHNGPQTPPNKYSMPKNTTPTPPAYTFGDDDEFYPGTDPRVKKNSRQQGP